MNRKNLYETFSYGKNMELFYENTERFYFNNSGNIRFLRYGTFNMSIFQQLLKDMKYANKTYTNLLKIVRSNRVQLYYQTTQDLKQKKVVPFGMKHETSQ